VQADTTPPEPIACAVRVPCSTSNLGAGFDCIGLAFDRYLDAGYEPDGDALHVRRAGALHALDIGIDDDVLISTFRAALERRGVRSVGGTLLITSAIPVGRGLGSSAAAVVAGLALAAAACGESFDRGAALATAARIEGHPDNAAPALFGGLVGIAHGGDGAPLAMPLPLSPELRFAFAAPDVDVSTKRARAALPQHVPHSAAVRNLGRMAALLHGLANADGDALAIGFTDELHVPYRLPLIPGAKATLAAALDAGALGATISGSGSGLIAVCRAGSELRVLDAMVATLRVAGAGSATEADGFVARPDMHGVQPRDFGTLREALRP
jgi:homoserine kinase